MTGTTAIGEAPGKIIITGEHFVVHGGLALAAAVDMRVRAEVWKKKKKEEGPMVVEATRSAAGQPAPDVSSVRALISSLYRDRGEGKPAVHVRLTSQIPSGSGLGSSAAAMVATAAAIGKLEGWRMNDDALIESAMVGERQVHGRPSGIDVNVSALGGVILFRMGETPKRVELPERVQVIVVHSGKVRDTRRLIEKVSARRARAPQFFSALSGAVTILSELASTKLVELDLEGLGALLTLNHLVLGAVGAGNRVLDGIVELCLSAGCYGAKLTGAGGGGSVIALPRPGTGERVRAEIADSGYTCFLLTIPSGGVQSRVVRE